MGGCGTDPQNAAEPQSRKNMHDILSSASSAICAHRKVSAFVWIACCRLHAIAVEAFFLNTFSELGVCDFAPRNSTSRTEKPLDRYMEVDPLPSLGVLHPSGTVDRWPGHFFRERRF